MSLVDGTCFVDAEVVPRYLLLNFRLPRSVGLLYGHQHRGRKECLTTVVEILSKLRQASLVAPSVGAVMSAVGIKVALFSKIWFHRTTEYSLSTNSVAENF